MICLNSRRTNRVPPYLRNIEKILQPFGVVLFERLAEFRDLSIVFVQARQHLFAIAEKNREQVLTSLDKYDREVAKFRQALEQNDAEGLKNLLNIAKIGRDAIGPA